LEEEYATPGSPGGGFAVLRKPGKFYAVLACSITGRNVPAFFPRTANNANNVSSKNDEVVVDFRDVAKGYYRSLLRRPWTEGRNLVIGSEEFDGFVRDLLLDENDENENDENNVDAEGTKTTTTTTTTGEEAHVSKRSGRLIDELLSVLPWEDGTEPYDDREDDEEKDLSSSSSSSSFSSSSSAAAATKRQQPPPPRRRHPPLRLRDVEIQINHRTPRIDHLASIWHQRGDYSTLRNFLVRVRVRRRSSSSSSSSSGGVGRSGDGDELYQLNSLALALQFVRKGIRTTIVSMEGVREREEEEEEAAAAAEAMAMAMANDGGNGIATGIAVGGLQGTVACEILRMGDGRSAVAAFRGNGTTTTTTTIAPSFVCDDRNRIHLPSTTTATTTAAGGSYGETTTTTEAAAELANLRQNRKSDRSSRNLTPDQLEEIDAVLERYDCGVWRHLRRYQRRGLLRVLSPSKRLFGGCDFDDSDDGGGGSSSSLLSSKPRRRDDDLTFREAIDAVAEIAARDNGIPFQTDEPRSGRSSTFG